RRRRRGERLRLPRRARATALGRAGARAAAPPPRDPRLARILGVQPRGLVREWLFANRGSREAEWSDHCNAADVRWVLRERPFVVAGADPRGFAAEVP